MSSRSFSTSCKRKSILLDSVAPNCNLKQWHQNNFSKIKNNKFDSNEWIQPSCDHRTYKYVQLSNGMQVLLIYDNKQERKSLETQHKNHDSSNHSTTNDTNGNNYYNVSLCVARGYFSDFPDCAGIAHYCEHMLFMGNKKYPGENSWEDWLSLKGGSTNAATYNLFTNYVFDMVPGGKQLLFESLDRFAHNFISPLFNPDSRDRELTAIENEFNLHKTDDAYKQWLVLKQHVLRLEDIPYYKFGSGNKSTLNSPLIHDRLIEFYRSNYAPQRMSLVILSDIDFDTLEPYVIQLFEQIKDPNEQQQQIIHEEKDTTPNDDELHPLRLEPNLLEPVYGKLFRVNSVKEHYTMDMYWMLNGRECSAYYDSSPTTFLSELLGHEGIGSLHSLLTDRKWINDLECGYENDVEGINHSFELFEINFDLTQQGYHHVDDIMRCVFSYLAMLKEELLVTQDDEAVSKMKQYWMESKLLGDISFNFANHTNGWQLVDDLSIKMHQYPIHHLLSCDYIYWTYDAQLLSHALGELTPDRCCVMLQSIDAIRGDKPCKVEPILDTKYSIEDIPKSWLVMQQQNYNKLFDLPPKNTFIPSDLSLLSDDIISPQHFLDIEWQEKCGPELLVYNECMKMYYKLDRTYFVPKSYITIVFEHDEIWTQNAQNMTALSLWCDMFNQSVSKQSYQPTLAGLDFELSQCWRGLKLRLSGYSDKLYAYFEHLIRELATFKVEDDELLFSTQKMKYIRQLNNAIIDCEDHLSYIGRKCIIHNAVTIDAEVDAAQRMTMQQLQDVRDLLFDKHDNALRVYALFMGNIAPEAVQNASTLVMNMFNIAAMDSLLEQNRFLSPLDQQSMRLAFSKCKCQAIELPPVNLSIYRERCVSSEEDNNGTSIVFAMSDETVSARSGMLCSLLANILSEPFYDALRTKQQLGYEVSVTYETVANIPFLKFQIISSQYNPHYLALQILSFINDTFYKEYVLGDKLRGDNLQDKIDSAIRSRKMECQSLSSRHNMYWAEIFTYNTLTFDAKLKEVEALSQITFEHIKTLYDTKLLMLKNNQTKCIVLQIWKQQEDAKDEEDIKEEEEEVVLNMNNIRTVKQLEQHIAADLKLSDFVLTEIDSISSWQKSLNPLPSYL
eukprot:539986_1